MRERDVRNGTKLLGGTLLEKIRFSSQILGRPGWLMRFLFDGGVPPLANVVIPGKGPMPLIDVVESLAYSAITWEDLRWIKDVWRGPVILEDAYRRGCPARDRCGSGGHRGVQPRRETTRRRASYVARSAGNRLGGKWSNRSADRQGGFAAALISLRPSASELAPSFAGEPTPMAWRRQAKREFRERSKSSLPICSGPCGCWAGGSDSGLDRTYVRYHHSH